MTDGLKLLVSAGGTREPIDSVRYIGNRSSGRMGFALAEVAADLGAEVTVAAANVELPRDPRITYVEELGKYVIAYTAFSKGGPTGEVIRVTRG